MLLTGDVLDVLSTLEADSFDAMLTDPPYGLEFMGKEWDGTRGFESSLARAGTSKPGIGDRNTEWPSFYGGLNPRCRNCGRSQRGGSPCRCDKPDFPNERRNRAVLYQEWCEAWAAETLRVLKPGAFALVFGGTRTFHRLAVALEDAGFEVRDTLMWVYGSGFPKSKNLDGDWQGYGTSLKPAYEPVLLVRKPTPLTYAQNALRYGTGALNIDGAKVPGAKPDTTRGAGGQHGRYSPLGGQGRIKDDGSGRWPANLIHDGSDEVVSLFPHQKSGGTPPRRPADKNRAAYGAFRGQEAPEGIGSTSGSAARFFYTAKASTKEREAGLDGLPEQLFAQSGGAQAALARGENEYQGEDASTGLNRVKKRRNVHPTVKPLALTEYLAKLLLPPERDTPRRILVPFAGSGSEIIGALRAGWDEAVGIEREPEYVAIAERRIRHWLGERCARCGSEKPEGAWTFAPDWVCRDCSRQEAA